MVASRAPEDGDVVVRPEWREHTLVYALNIAPGPDQYLRRSREEAITQALTFAKREHVRAWLSDEDYDFVLLEDFRVQAFVSRRARFHDGPSEDRQENRTRGRPRMEVTGGIGTRDQQRPGPSRRRSDL
jgi:hypothetical protein